MNLARHHYTRLQLALVGSGVAVLSVLLVTTVRLWPVVTQSFAPAQLTCGCLALSVRPSWWVTGGTLVVMAVTAVAFGRLLWSLATTAWRSERQRRRWSRLPGRHVTHGRSDRPYLLITSEQPVAATVGWWRPQVVISTALVRRLTGSEFAAVLGHEEAHRRSRDPLLTAIMAAVTSALAWLPWMRSWLAAAYSWRELAADGAATDEYRRTGPLSAAFLKLLDAPLQPEVSGFSPNRDRLERLLDARWLPSRRIWGWPAMLGFGVVILSMVTFGRFAQAATQDLSPTATTICRETATMCRAEGMTVQTNTICHGEQCRTFGRPITSTYAITWVR